MAEFPHLPLPQKVERKNYVGQQTPRKKPQRSIDNLLNRQVHGSTLRQGLSELEEAWALEIDSIQGSPIVDFIDPQIIPIFLKIDIKTLNIDALRGFGIEIISQEDDGFVIGASVDAFNKLKIKIDRFENNDNSNTAYLWQIDHGLGWRRDMILSPELNAKLDSLAEDEMLELDISIACNIHVPDKPIRREDESEDRYENRLNRWKEKATQRDEVYFARSDQFESIVSVYGSIRFEYDYNDSFGCRVQISVKGLKDILYNYPYVFEIVEHDYLENLMDGATDESQSQAQINAPGINSPRICIIDSGIMEGHRLLAPAILTQTSKTYVPGETVADLVDGGGHGTRVAGAVLFPNDIALTGDIQLPFWLQNAKILNRSGYLDESLFPPDLMRAIVADFSPTKIYNLSVSGFGPCRTTHMSLWAAAIDKLMWENDLLFIVAVGNITKDRFRNRPGIKDFLRQGLSYPGYLNSENSCRIANPSQSCFALSVGSISIGEFEDADRISFAKNYGNIPGPSPFSRTGLGLWGMIKPDVVELGGDLVREKNANPNIVEHVSTSPHLVKSINTSNEATGKDRVGTSFATPKVSHIVANLQREFPNESCLFFRGLTVQSARLPEYALLNPNVSFLRHFGYGLPSIERALDNKPNRITLYSNGRLNAKRADLYLVKIPNQMNRPGEDFDVLVEITLSYKANPRRTRMRTNSYLSHWLDWKTSKLGEPFDEFSSRIINSNDEFDAESENDNELVEEEQPKYSELPWAIRERGNIGLYKSVKRQDSTLQKDWMIIKSYNLPSEIGIAITGHKGWSVDLEEELPYTIFVSFEALNAEIDIYSMIQVENRIEVPIEVHVD